MEWINIFFANFWPVCFEILVGFDEDLEVFSHDVGVVFGIEFFAGELGIFDLHGVIPVGVFFEELFTVKAVFHSIDAHCGFDEIFFV